MCLESTLSPVPSTILEEMNLENSSDKPCSSWRKEMFASVQLVADQLICSHLRSKATNHLSLRPRFEAHIPNTSAYLRAQDALIFMAQLFKPVALSASHSPSTNSPGRRWFVLLVTPLPPIAMTKAWGEGFILFHLTYFFPPSLPSFLSSFLSSFLT